MLFQTSCTVSVTHLNLGLPTLLLGGVPWYESAAGLRGQSKMSNKVLSGHQPDAGQSLHSGI